VKLYDDEKVSMAEAVIKNFLYFANRTKGMRQIYDKLTQNVKDTIKIGLCEMDSLKPSLWDAWWLVNHGRFTLTGNEARAMHTFMYHYLTAFFHKRVGTNIKLELTKRVQNSI
jgi:hypothetical protein